MPCCGTFFFYSLIFFAIVINQAADHLLHFAKESAAFFARFTLLALTLFLSTLPFSFFCFLLLTLFFETKFFLFQSLFFSSISCSARLLFTAAFLFLFSIKDCWCFRYKLPAAAVYFTLVYERNSRIVVTFLVEVLQLLS